MRALCLCRDVSFVRRRVISGSSEARGIWDLTASSSSPLSSSTSSTASWNTMLSSSRSWGGGGGERTVGLVFTETANRGLLTCSFQLPVRLLNQLYHATVHWQMHSTGPKVCVCDLFYNYYYPSCHMGSHISSSEDLSPVLESECCYAKNLSWLKIVPAELRST